MFLGHLDARVKQTSLEYAPPSAEPVWTEEAQAAASAPVHEALQTTDPTVANAGLTEIQEPSVVQAAGANGFSTTAPPQTEETTPAQSTVNNAAANPLAQSNWDNQGGSSMMASTIGEGWVDIQAPEKTPEAGLAPEGPRPPLESSNSWAEDIPVAAAPPPAGPPQGDGFERVIHHTRQGSGRGRGSRGRGPRGDGFRGRGGSHRGDRGDHRGRGRGRGGEYRGRGRGGFSNQGPPAESAPSGQ